MNKVIITKDLLGKIIEGEAKTFSLVEKRGLVLTVKDYRGRIFSGVVNNTTDKTFLFDTGETDTGETK